MRLIDRVERADLATRLLLAIVVVVVVGAATAWAVGAAVGPGLFHEHMLRTTGTAESATEHAERAFATASALSLSLSLLAALGASAAVSLVLARRIRRSLAPLGAAAERVAAGDLTVRVDPPGVGPEFDQLAGAFTAMAAELARVEQTRTQLLADLAHEMRTPVAVLGGYLEAFAEGVEAPDEETVRMLREQVDRLARLSEDVALVTSAEEGRLRLERRETNLADVALEAVAQAQARHAGAGVDVFAEAPDVLAVDADPDRIGQVLTNLLDNAVRHTPAGGRVTVRASRDRDDAVVTVSDTGEGIAAEHLARVFDRFYRVDAAIARAHSGSLDAASPGPGAGATFTLRVPIARGRPPSRDERSGQRPEHGPGRQP